MRVSKGVKKGNRMKKLYTTLFMLCYLFSFAPVSATEEARTGERRHHGGHHRGGNRDDHHRSDRHRRGQQRGHHRGGHHDGHHGRRYGHHGRGRHHHFIPRDPEKRRLFCERHPRPCQRRGIVIPSVIAASTPTPGQEGLVNPAASEVIIDTGLTEHTAVTPEEEGYEEAEEDPTATLGQTYFEDEEEEGEK